MKKGSRVLALMAAAVVTVVFGGCNKEDRCDVEFTLVSVPGLGGNTVPALVPTLIVINGTGFPTGGAAKIILMGDGGALCFADGTSNTIEIAGTVTSSTTIEATTPRCTNPIVGSGVSALSVDLQGASIQIWTECGDSAPSAPGAILFDRPDGQIAIAGTSGPQIALQTAASAFTITTVAPMSNVYDPPGGGTVDVTFVTAGTPFQGGLASTATVTGVLTSSTTITGVTPLAVAPADFTATVNVVFEDGTVGDGTPLAAVTFTAPPIIASFVNTRPPFDQSITATLNADRCLACLSTPVQVNGSNFAPGAIVEIFDTANGDSDPIGSGALSTPVVSPAQITGGSPTDSTLSSPLTQATVRVTNPDGQFATFTPVFFSTLDVLANVNASAQAGNNAEMNIAVNPTNPRNAVICAHDGGGFAVAFTAFTTDGGATWTTVLVGSGQDGLDPGNANAIRVDPMCAADAFGNFYIGYLEFQRIGSNPVVGTASNVVILQSANGGATWINPRIISSVIIPAGGATLDRCEIATGPAQGLGGGQAVYVVYRDFTNPASQIQINGFRSTGLGNLAAAGFGVTTCHNIPPGAGNDYFSNSAAVGPVGQVYVTFIERNSNTAPGNIWINADPDGLGALAFGFTGQVFVTTTNAPNTRVAESVNFLGDGYPRPQRNRGYASTPAVEVILAGPFVGRVVVAYDDRFFNDGIPGDEVNFGLRIMTRFSDSGGASWSSAAQAHVLDTRHQWQPWMTTDPVTGNVYVTWFDSIGDLNNRAVRRWSAVSSDGAGWGNPLALSQAPSDVINDTFLNNYLEYEGVAAYGGCVYACWNDFSGFAAPNATSGEVYTSTYQQDP